MCISTIEYVKKRATAVKPLPPHFDLYFYCYFQNLPLFPLLKTNGYIVAAKPSKIQFLSQFMTDCSIFSKQYANPNCNRSTMSAINKMNGTKTTCFSILIETYLICCTRSNSCVKTYVSFFVPTLELHLQFPLRYP